MREIKRGKTGYQVLAVAALSCALLGGRAARAEDMSDSTLLLAGRLLHRSVSVAMESPLKSDPEAGEVMLALRSTRDAQLLPIFQKVRASKSQENQIFAMVSCATLLKDAGVEPRGPAAMDFKALFATTDTVMQTSALGMLINGKAITEAELKEVLATAPEPIQKAMAAGELNLMKKLGDRKPLMDLLRSEKQIVRYDAALTILDGGDAADKAAALETIKKLSAAHDLRQAQVEALMLDRMQKEKIADGLPWALQIAGDEAAEEALRYEAVSVALSFKAPEAQQIIADMLQKQHDAIQQVKLGLICAEYAPQKKDILAPLAASKSSLVRSIARIAQKSMDKGDFTPELLDLIKEGHPIVLDWSYQYCDRTDNDRRLVLRTALVKQATIVDNVRDRDYERAALSAERIIADDGPEGRKVIAALLNSENRAVVDATLSGIYRSGAKDGADLVLQIWGGLTKITSAENAANYATLILAREGHKEALTRLPGMVVGGTVQGPGFRALAGWYYAKLNGQGEALLKTALAD